MKRVTQKTTSQWAKEQREIAQKDPEYWKFYSELVQTEDYDVIMSELVQADLDASLKLVKEIKEYVATIQKYSTSEGAKIIAEKIKLQIDKSGVIK